MAIASFRSKFGSPEERNRLAQFYAALTDGELQQLAGEAGSLTDEAKGALESEMSRRKLGANAAGEPAAEGEDSAAANERAEMRELLTIRQFRDLPEALLAKSVLDSAGMQRFFGGATPLPIAWVGS